MNEPLVSSAWFRVADLRPQLAPGAVLVRQAARDRIWHLLTDPGSGRQVRLNRPAWAFAGRCDGNRRVGEIWSQLVECLGDAAPSQDDVLRLLAQLHAGGLMHFDSVPNLTALFARRDESTRRRKRAWINPLVVRMRLIDPSALLERLAPRLSFLFSKPALATWCLCVAAGALLCAMQFAALKADAVRLFDTPRALLLFWLCYPPVKGIHELAHAMAVRHFGGAVREAGITLMFFTPAPYVDASAASAFTGRRERILVSAAGIVAELFIAAGAAMLWSSVQPGMVRDGALTVLMICAVSTLAVNANPLLRFDGYYIASDALDLPNLALRSNAWWTVQWRKLLSGSPLLDDNTLAAGERKWLIIYAPLSLAWRILLMVSLVQWAGGKSALLGSLLGTGLAIWLLLRLLGALRGIAAVAPTAAGRRRAMLVTGGACGAAALLLFAVPVPNTVVAPGVVWPADDAQVRTQTAGFVTAVTTRHGEPVAPEQLLIRLREENLEADSERLQSQLAGHRAKQYVALLRDPAQAVASAGDIERVEAELERTETQLAQLDVRGRSAGKLVLPHAADLEGSYAARGALLGYILTGGAANVRAALGESDALLVRHRVQDVEVRPAEMPMLALPAHLEREAPAAVRQLPSAALGDRAGGRFAIDPADREGTRTIDPIFTVDVKVPGLAADRIGGRVWVRFELGREPIGSQILRRARQLLLQHFNPAGQAWGVGA